MLTDKRTVESVHLKSRDLGKSRCGFVHVDGRVARGTIGLGKRQRAISKWPPDNGINSIGPDAGNANAFVLPRGENLASKNLSARLKNLSAQCSIRIQSRKQTLFP
jgi:hypothetical protein